MRCFLLSGPNLPPAAQAIREVAEAITHAKFVGTSPASDEVVLMKILNVSVRRVQLACVHTYTCNTNIKILEFQTPYTCTLIFTGTLPFVPVLSDNI